MLDSLLNNATRRWLQEKKKKDELEEKKRAEEDRQWKEKGKIKQIESEIKGFSEVIERLLVEKEKLERAKETGDFNE